MSEILSGNAVIDARLAELLRDGVQFTLFSLPFKTKLRFVGEVAQEPRAGAVAFLATAELGAPFDLAVAVRLTIADSGRYALRFALPDLPKLLDAHVRGRLGAAQKAYDALVQPYVAAFRGCTAILSSSAGDDPALGGVLAGINFYSDVRLGDVEPTRSLCEAFPRAGIDDRRFVLHMGCPLAAGFAFVVEGSLVLAAELGTPAVVLDRLTLRVDQFSASLAASASVRFTLRVGGEALAFVGALGIDSAGQVMVAGSLDAEDGAWQDPFGARGVTIVGVGVQLMAAAVAPYIGVGLRGGVRVGGEKFGADVALLFDPASPDRSVLQIVNNSGYDLRRLLDAVVDAGLVPAELVDVRIDDILIHISPSGGEIAGKLYAAGFALAGDLELWGFRARVSGLLSHDRGGHLHGATSPLRFPGDGWLVKLEGEPGAGPEVRIDFNATRRAAWVQGAVKLALRYDHAFELAVDSERLHVALARTHLGIYTGGALELRKGRASLTTAVGFHQHIKVHVGRFPIEFDADVDASYRAQATTTDARQDVRFAFDACGERLAFEVNAGQLRFEEVESLAKLFVAQSGRIAQLLADEVRTAALAALTWLSGQLGHAQHSVALALRDVGAACGAAADGLRQLYGLAADPCATLLRQATYSAQAIAGAMKSAYALTEAQVGALLDRIGYPAKDIAKAMHKAFDWSAKQTAEFCDEVLDLGDKATRSALEAADYGKSEIKGAMEDVFDWGEDVWDTVTGIF